MEDLIISNYKDYIGKTILDWNIIDAAELPTVYAIVLKRNDSEKIFYIRRRIIKGSVLNLNEDVYELWYKNFEDAGPFYGIVLKKESTERVFLIRKTVIKGSALRLDNDVYELLYKDFQDSRLLTLSDTADMDVVISKIQELLEKYSKYE